MGAKATRDRKAPLPKRLVLKAAHRIEDSAMWQRYASKRAQIAANRDQISLIKDLPGSGPRKINNVLPSSWSLEGGLNELYLFHGTCPAAAFGIREDGFLIS